MPRALPLLALALLAACAGGNGPAPLDAAPADTSWRTVVTPFDRDRLRKWRTAWVEAVDKVRASGKAGELRRDTVLFDPDRALAKPLPPAGDYRCRMVKLGARASGQTDVAPYPAFDCRVSSEDGRLSLAILGGAQRPVGILFEDLEARGVFLGTLVLGDETAPLNYGQDRARDLAGVVERIGAQRWRIVLPYPAFESTLDLIELVPA